MWYVINVGQRIQKISSSSFFFFFLFPSSLREEMQRDVAKSNSLPSIYSVIITLLAAGAECEG